jgi:3-oxoisoapionate decarboxylase
MGLMFRSNRRRFLIRTLAASAMVPVASGLQGQEGSSTKLRLGIDNFAVRDMGWKGTQLVDYADSLGCDCVFITDLDSFESLEPAKLAEVRKHADDKKVQIYLGTWSICPTSTRFKNNRGSAEELLRLGIQSAVALGSPVLRVVLGSWDDRKTEGGIRARIADTVKVLKACRGEAVEKGIKIAVENHAGDLLASELVDLIEAAGKDFVGANMDSGNAVWTFEDPLANLETLGPYALTTSLRDSHVWESDNGVTVQWTAMGDGYVNWKKYFERFAQLCPRAPVCIETISGFNRELPLFQAEFADLYRDVRMQSLAPLLKAAEKGVPQEAWKPAEGADRGQATKEYQKSQLEKSIRYCRETLGLGLRAPTA